ncbi:MAG TPA: ribonuclease HI family protein [Anaeromyxobacteraceae bacterium]|nr:ribonuclease HI family protein [Anaeromyxobacteraceae bacterium]
MAKPVLAELLRFIAANELLPRTLERYKGYDRDAIGKLVAAAADRVEQVEAAAGDPPPARRRPEVRKSGEERAAARPTEAAGRTRLFTDGAARGNPGPAGAGAVIVSPQGHIVAKVGKFLGENTNNYAEYMGLILGLRRAKAMGIKELEVLADSELVVRQLNGEYQVKAENLKALFEEARQLLSAFSEARVRHIPREENEAADEMSNRAIDERL